MNSHDNSTAGPAASTVPQMAEFLFSRAEGAPPSDLVVDEIGTPMFFQMWQTRQPPYNTLADGDTLWWVDQRSRQIRWELRVRNLRRSGYESVALGLDRLRRWFGMLPSELTEYHKSVRPEGWLLAWDCDVIGPVGLQLPDAVKLGRNGFKAVSFSDARSVGLPAPGRPALVESIELPNEPDLLAPPRTRHIPISVRREVFDRDGRICAICGQTNSPMHLDHIYPWSKGGTNDPENLQVLCGPCNITKGAATNADATIIPVIEELRVLAAELARPVPHDSAQLSRLFGSLISAGRGMDAVELAWAIERHPDARPSLLNEVSNALGALSDDDAVHAELFASVISGGPTDRLVRLAAHPDAGVSERAAAWVAEASDLPDPQRLKYARHAYTSDDKYVRALGALHIGVLTSDDDEWRSMRMIAHDEGDPLTASTAAFHFGAEADDEQTAYVFLEEAMRSPLPGVAASAARHIAKLLAHDPTVSAWYQAAADEIEQLGGLNEPISES